jgi:hypothetical protein
VSDEITPDGLVQSFLADLAEEPALRVVMAKTLCEMGYTVVPPDSDREAWEGHCSHGGERVRKVDGGRRSLLCAGCRRVLGSW